MKKIKYVSFMLLGLFLTGCTNGKKIECAYYEKADDQKITYDYTFNFNEKGDILRTYEMTSEIELKSADINQYDADDLCDMMLSGYSDDVKKYISCKAKKSDNTMSITLKYDYDKLDEATKKDLLDDITYDKFKENYEQIDYEADICVFNSNKKMEPVLYNNGILSMLNGAREAAAEDTAYGILQAGESFMAAYILEHHGDFPGNLVFVCDENDCSTTLDGQKQTLDFKGTKPTSGEITVTLTSSAITKTLVINGYMCDMKNDDEIECIK